MAHLHEECCSRRGSSRSEECGVRSEITSEHEHEHEHDHEHHHHHEHSLKRQLGLIIATVILLAVAVFIEHVSNSYSSSSSASGVFSHLLPLTSHLSPFSLLLIYLVPYLLIGHETLHEAWEGITHGDAFNEHFLMSVATIGALLIGFLPGAETEFPEAVFVMLFFQVGELFEDYAEGQSRKSIAHLMDIRPDVAHVEVSRSSSRNEEGGTRKEITIKRRTIKCRLSGRGRLRSGFCFNFCIYFCRRYFF